MGTAATRVFAFSGATYAGKTCTGLSALPDAAGKYSFNLPAGNYWFGVLKDGVYTLEDQNQTMVVPQTTTHSIVSSDTATYTYDALSRLTSATYNDGRTFTYGYDATGNRVQQVAGNAFALPVTSNYAYDPANRLTSDGTKTYTWDADGNLTGDGARTFTFDSANRLRQVVIGANTYTYGYDGDGNRINSAVNGGTALHYQNDNSGLSQVLSESAPQGYGTNLYIPGLVQSSIDGTNAQYFLQDALGSNVMLADAGANWTVLPQYDPYGASAPTSLTAFGYTGEEKDPNVNLIDLRSRWYDPETGRFISKDAWQGDYTNPATLNQWIYTEDNPVNRADPSGHCDSGKFPILLFVPLAGPTLGQQQLGTYIQSCIDDLQMAGSTLKDSLKNGYNSDPNNFWSEDPAALATIQAIGLQHDMVAANNWLGNYNTAKDTAYGPNSSLLDRGVALAKLNVYGGEVGLGVMSIASMLMGCPNPSAEAESGSIVLDDEMAVIASNKSSMNTDLPVVENEIKSLPSGEDQIIPQLSQGNNKLGLDHIVLNHWYSSGVSGKSQFSSNIDLRELVNLISQSAGPKNLWTQEGNSFVRVIDAGKIIGTDTKGDLTSILKVVVDSAGRVTTAYPISK